ncbi:ER membrane protein complex subunit 4 [Scenedesmus sp. PABB004]|nr:ER membrane protein complex subunit 4 [Scenedesmus sp. PABB004]
MAPPAPAPWRMDFGSVEGLRHANKLDPPGFDAAAARDWVPGGTSVGRRRDPKLIEKKQQALWTRATSPFRQVGFMVFMMWMMGNSLQIFSIIMTLSGLAGPLTAVLKSAEAFPPDPERKLDTLSPRLLYCLINLGQAGFALHKLNAMGLLPSHPSDWISSMPVPRSLEASTGAL